MLTFDEKQRIRLHKIVSCFNKVENDGAKALKISGFDIKEDNSRNY